MSDDNPNTNNSSPIVAEGSQANTETNAEANTDTNTYADMNAEPPIPTAQQAAEHNNQAPVSTSSEVLSGEESELAPGVMPSSELSNSQLSPVQRANNDFIYAIGIIEVRFPNKGVEKQFLQAAMSLAVNEQDFYGVFTNQGSKNHADKYFYIAEQVQWVLCIEKEPCYLVRPVSELELRGLIESMKAPVNIMDPLYTCVIGELLPGANNLGLPEVASEQVFSQTITQLQESVDPSMAADGAMAVNAVIKELEFHANKGNNTFARARNFLALRYPAIYKHTHNMHAGKGDGSKASLVSIELTLFDGLSEHVIVDVSLTFQENNSTTRHYYFCRVDVTGLFPYVNTDMQRFIPLTPVQDSFE